MALEFKRGIYLISPPSIGDLKGFCEDLDFLLQSAYISLFQLRLKGVSAEKIAEVAGNVADVCRSANVPFILNDDPQLAHAIGADGVHIGKDDGGLERAKSLMRGKIIGASCYNKLDFALHNAENGASYVAFGAMYETTSKVIEFHATPELISDFKARSTVPVCAIGGINSGNVAAIVAHKPDLVAVISAIWGRPDRGAMLDEAGKLYRAIMA